MPFLLLDSEKQYADQQDFQSHVQSLLNPPVPADQADRQSVPEPDAGAMTLPPPASPQPSPPATAVPASAPLTTSPGMAQPSAGQQFSPYDSVFAKYAGPLANDPMFMSIVAAGTKAESQWDAANTTGDGGHSWGLFQMHDAGAGAGMGNARLDPDAASARMVPAYAAAYQIALSHGLTGAALVAATAQGAERSADPSGAAYAKAWHEIMGGATVAPGRGDAGGSAFGGAPASPGIPPSTVASPLDDFASHVSTLTNGAVTLGQNIAGGVKDDVSAFNDHVKQLTGGLVDLSGDWQGSQATPTAPGGQMDGLQPDVSQAPENGLSGASPTAALTAGPTVPPAGPPSPPVAAGPLDLVKQKFSDALDAFGSLFSGSAPNTQTGSLPGPTPGGMLGSLAAPPNGQVSDLGQVASGVGNYLTEPQPFLQNVVGGQTRELQAGAGISPNEPGVQAMTPSEQYVFSRGIATGLTQAVVPEDLIARATTQGAGSLASSAQAAEAALHARQRGELNLGAFGARPSAQETLAAAEDQMAALRAKYPQMSDGSAASSGLGKQIADLRSQVENVRPTSGDAAMLEPEVAATLPQASAAMPANVVLEGLINQAKAKAKGFDTSALEAQLRPPEIPAETPAVGQGSPARGPSQPPGSRGGVPPVEPPGAPPAGPTGPEFRAPVTRDQVAPQGPLSRIVQTVNSAFQPMENLPDGEVKDALKRFAAATGAQSQGARVVAATDAHAFGADADLLRQGNLAQARADLNGVLQSNGLSEATPEVAAILNAIRQPSAIASNPLGKAVLGANSAIKGSLFGLSNMHNYTEAVTSLAAGGPEAMANYARAFVSPSFYDGVRYGSLAGDFNRAAMAGVTGLLHGGAGGSDIQQLSAVVTRAVIGAVGGAGAGYEESLRAGDSQNALRNALIGGAAGAGAGVAAPALFGSMFGRAVPLAKVTVFKQLTAGGLDELQAAAAVNRTFGGLNYAQMGRSQTLQDAMRLMMTAPDWNEATVREIGAAITGKNRGFSAGVLAKAVGGSMIASELLSYALTGHSTADNEPGHQLEVQIGTDKSGKPVYMGFMPGNVQAYGNLIDKLVTVPDSGKYTSKGNTLLSFAEGRAGLPIQTAARLAGSEYLGGPASKNTAAATAALAAPIGVDSAIQGLERGASWQDVLASILAGPNLRYGSKPVPPTRSIISTFQAPTTRAPVPAGRYHP